MSPGGEAPGGARAKKPAGSVPVCVCMCPTEGRPTEGPGPEDPPALCR